MSYIIRNESIQAIVLQYFNKSALNYCDFKIKPLPLQARAVNDAENQNMNLR